MSFVIGVVIIRELLGLGSDAYALYVLIVMGFGISALGREVMRVALVGNLGAALGHDDGAVFRRALGTTWIICFGVVILAAFLLGIILLSMGGFGIRPDLLGDARQFVLIRGVQILTMLLIYPLMLTLLIQRKQVHLNGLLVLERAYELAALTAAIAWTVGEFQTLIRFASLSTSIFLVHGALLLYGILRQRQNRPLLPHNVWSALRDMRANLRLAFLDIGWPMLYFRFNVVFLTATFGPVGAVLVGLPVQIAGYVGQLSTALVGGLEAILARSFYAGGQADDPTPAKIVLHSSSLQMLVIGLFLGFLTVNLDGLVRLWLADRLVGSSLDQLTTVTKVLLPGVFAIALSNPWRSILTGTGRLRSFVPVAVGFALVNPVVAALGYFVWDLEVYEMALLLGVSYSTLNVIYNLLFLPARVSVEIGVSRKELLQALLVPILIILTTMCFNYFLYTFMLTAPTIWMSLGVFMTGGLVGLFFNAMFND